MKAVDDDDDDDDAVVVVAAAAIVAVPFMRMMLPEATSACEGIVREVRTVCVRMLSPGCCLSGQDAL